MAVILLILKVALTRINFLDDEFDIGALDDPGDVCDSIGDTSDCFNEQGKVLKEILEVGSGIDKPKMGYLCRIRYIAYYFDKEIFDTSPNEGAETIDL
jgi:hypothetical protein